MRKFGTVGTDLLGGVKWEGSLFLNSIWKTRFKFKYLGSCHLYKSSALGPVPVDLPGSKFTPTFKGGGWLNEYIMDIVLLSFLID